MPPLSDTTGQLSGSGLMGYISSKTVQPAAGYGAGIGFYVAVYPILPEPIDYFQIGLASTWITPANADNTTTPLCPPGSYARDNWSDGRGPTFRDVFQTIEGGLGMWESTQFRAGYKPPKFQIVGVPDCYTGNYLISPGWSTTDSPSASRVACNPNSSSIPFGFLHWDIAQICRNAWQARHESKQDSEWDRPRWPEVT